jgi:hypothetical protein
MDGPKAECTQQVEPIVKGLPGCWALLLLHGGDVFDILIDDIDGILPLLCFFSADKTPYAQASRARP